MEEEEEELDLDLDLDFRSPPRELLSLQELSMTAAASLIWGSKEMKTAIEEVLDRQYPLWRDPNVPLKMEKLSLQDLPVKLSEIMCHIFNQGQISLPQVIKTKIENKVLEKVEEMVDWILYLIRGLKLNYKTAERIYWTADERIDEDKIFRLFWSHKLPEEAVKWKRFDDNLTLLQYLACFFGQEEFILLNLSDYIKALKSQEVEKYDDIVLTIMKTVISFYNDRIFVLPNVLKRVKLKIPNVSTLEMLNICKRFCLYKAFLFFWKRLDATKKLYYLQYELYPLYGYNPAMHGRNEYLKIILFLMERMHDRRKYNFIFNNFSEVILTFSRNKNYKKFCMPLVEHFLPKLGAADKRNLLTNCADICNRSIHFDIELEIVNRLLKNVPLQRTIRMHHRGFIILDTEYNRRVIETFFLNFNLRALKVIIKDESSESRKKELISFGETKFKELILNSNFQLMDKFLEEVLLSEAEKDKFKQDYNFLEEWIVQCRFDKVDEVLIWMHGAASQEFKIPFINRFCSSIPKNYEAMEKLLIWFFNTYGPLINNCQSKLELLNDFCCGLIYGLWFPKDCNLIDREKAIDISTKILIFSFFTERGIQYFKTNTLANTERCVKFFSENKWPFYPIWENGRMYALDDFLNFCNVPKEKMDGIKNSLLNEDCRNWAIELQIQRGQTEVSTESS